MFKSALGIIQHYEAYNKLLRSFKIKKSGVKYFGLFDFYLLCFFCCPGAYCFALFAPVNFFICPGGIRPLRLE